MSSSILPSEKTLNIIILNYKHIYIYINFLLIASGIVGTKSAAVAAAADDDVGTAGCLLIPKMDHYYNILNLNTEFAITIYCLSVMYHRRSSVLLR